MQRARRAECPTAIGGARQANRRRAIQARRPDDADRRLGERDARRLLCVRRDIPRPIVHAARLRKRRSAVVADCGVHVHHILRGGRPDRNDPIAQHSERRHPIQRARHSQGHGRQGRLGAVPPVEGAVLPPGAGTGWLHDISIAHAIGTIPSRKAAAVIRTSIVRKIGPIWDHPPPESARNSMPGWRDRHRGRSSRFASGRSADWSG